MSPPPLFQVSVDEGSGFQGGYALISGHVQQVFVAADDEFCSGRNCTGEKHVVVGVGAYAMGQRGGVYEFDLQHEQLDPRFEINARKLLAQCVACSLVLAQDVR